MACCRKMSIHCVLDRLSCANYRAHGKGHGMQIKHTANATHMANQYFAMCLSTKHTTCLAHGKIGNLLCAWLENTWSMFGTRQNSQFAVCPYMPTAKQNIAMCFSALPSWNKIFGKMPSKLFLLCTHCTWYSMLNFGMFLDLFAIFSHFILLNGFPGISQIWTASVLNNRI